MSTGITDQYRRSFAELLAEAFRQEYPELHASLGDVELFSAEELLDRLERPKDPGMGHFALPIFPWLRHLRAKPPEVTARIAERIRTLQAGNGQTLAVEGVSGFLNARIAPEQLAADTLDRILGTDQPVAASDEGAGQTILIEYSSPNIAKPFGIGHLRTTVIGNSLRRILRTLGYTVVGINYPGDWGTQFGKMIVAFGIWGDEAKLDGPEPIKHLLDIYVRFHAEAESDPSLDDRAREAFRQLEDGDPGATTLWQRFRDISLREFQRVYDMLGVEFDLVVGESFLNDKMQVVIDRLHAAGLTKESRGALIVELPDDRLPPALLKKSDGATLYLTRDIAGAVWRFAEYGYTQSLYVVGTAQSDHFKQCVQVLKLLEDAEGSSDDQRIGPRIRHIDFGWIKFIDEDSESGSAKVMSTRKGQVILLEEVLNTAVGKVRDVIEEKSPNLPNRETVSAQVGIGAVIFSQLSVRRQTDVTFKWDEVLNFDGETGPYLQYTHARLASVLRNAPTIDTVAIAWGELNHAEEQRVLELLADYPEAVRSAARNSDPYSISLHLLKLASAFNRVYQRKGEDGKIDKIISDNDSRTNARLALVAATKRVIGEGLNLLGIAAPEEM